MATQWDDNEEIKIFREYLRIPTVHPDVDYEPCVEFLQREAAKLGLPVKLFYPGGPTKPIVIIEWKGTHPDLPKVVLNSHMDVVPVYNEYWTHPPFAADIDAEGRIYARGSQDMKCLGMQYLAAIRALKRDNIQLKRTLLVMFVPDEEIGGEHGMRIFTTTQEFKNLNVGFSLDEGVADPGDEFPVYYAERITWHVRFIVSGTPGHGSLLLKNTAGEKVRYLIDKFTDYRANEANKLENNPDFTLGDVTSINLTIIKGGVQDNVIPPEMTLCFDCRLSILIDHAEFEAMMRRWMEEAGGGIELIFDQKDPYIQATSLVNNPFWDAFKNAIDELKLKIRPQICPGGTDSRYIRKVGIPAIGFSPMSNTPILLHDHDEYLGAETYLKGIEIWKKIILNVANA